MLYSIIFHVQKVSAMQAAYFLAVSCTVETLFSAHEEKSLLLLIKKKPKRIKDFAVEYIMCIV